MINPTHAIVNSDGTYSCVFPSGHSENLIALPSDYFSRGWYKLQEGIFIDDLSSWSTFICDKANNLRDQELFENYLIVPNVGSFDVDQKSRSLLYSCFMYIINNPTVDYTIPWTMSDNSVKNLTRIDISDTVNAIQQNDNLIHKKYSDIKAQARSASEILINLL